MKRIEDIRLPKELRYSAYHEWVGPEGDLARVGLTDYAQDQLGDMVYVELPSVGAHIAQGVVFATVESVKSVSECYMPLAGEVVSVNGPPADNPVLLNQAPMPVNGNWARKNVKLLSNNFLTGCHQMVVRHIKSFTAFDTPPYCFSLWKLILL